MYTFVIFNSGREVENLDAGKFDTQLEAETAARDALDTCCPPLSANRRFYRYEIVEAN